MSKWHKSIGTFRSPSLKDPLRPSSLPAVTIHEKRDVLVRNLLQNSAEAGDIPLDSPAVPITSLYFPDISMSQVEESILQAGNTAPGADEIPTCILKVAWLLIKDKIIQTDRSPISSWQRTRAPSGTEYGMDLYTLQSISETI
ncbi:hypothetical protein TSTA_052330, partial [Talaromyces stipitatus ATCC 10500]